MAPHGDGRCGGPLIGSRVIGNVVWRGSILGGALAALVLIAAACGGDEDSPPAPAAAQAEQTPATSDQAAPERAGPEPGQSAPSQEAVAEEAPGGPGDVDPTPSGGRGLLAGLDTDIRSVELSKIAFDLFNGRSVTLAEASEETILALVDVIPPLDANRALLDEVTAGRVGEVHYIEASEADAVPEDQLVLGYVADDGRAYAFPIGILNLHELVNDTLGGRAVLISYCPLCRSGVVYERVVDGTVLSFGNTSALFQNDLVMFDRQTNSYWFQTGGEAIVGVLTGTRLPVLPSTLIPWAAWRSEHPGTLVLSTQTGFTRNYLRDPFDGYERSVNAGRFPFDVDAEVLNDDRLPLGEMVLGVELGGEARAYPLNMLGDTAVNDEIAGRAVVVFSSASGPSGNAFDPHLDGERLRFRYADGAYEDAETGSRWSLSGLALDGPLAGAQLAALPSRSAFWFSYRSAFPEVVVFDVGGFEAGVS